MLPWWSFFLAFSHIGHEDAPAQFQFCDGTDTLWMDWKHFLPFDLPLKDGRLQTGDHILQIGGTNVQGMTSEQVAQVLRNCGNSVRMIVARDPKCEFMEAPPAPLSWPVSTLPSLPNGNVSICCFLGTFLSVFVACDQKGRREQRVLWP